MTKEIPLTQGKVAIIDDDLFDELSKYRWYAICPPDTRKNIYAARREKGTGERIYMHRFILGLQKDNILWADHINGNSLDNRRVNLRSVNAGQSQWNTNKHSNNKSGYKGVAIVKSHPNNPFRVTIQVNNCKTIHVGYYTDCIEAAKAYDQAALKYFGVYAKLNFPDAYHTLPDVTATTGAE